MKGSHGLAVLAVTCLIASACTSAGASAGASIAASAAATTGPTSTASGSPSPIATAAATEAARPTPSATPTLPADPVLVRTLQDEISAVYQIAVAPSSTPLDDASARARATKIGALVGVPAPNGVDRLYDQTVGQPAGYTWVASWFTQPGQSCPAPACIGGYPIDPMYAALRLEMDMYGTVLSFSRMLGPIPTKPARVISEARARQLAGGKWDRAQLVWTHHPLDSQAWRLIWLLDSDNLLPDGEKYPCVVKLDAESGAELMTGCVS